jgi:hypothetical protein
VCVLHFAVCFNMGTWQNVSLSCATRNTHGKMQGTWQNRMLSCVLSPAHGKTYFVVCLFQWHIPILSCVFYDGKVIKVFLLSPQNIFITFLYDFG